MPTEAPISIRCPSTSNETLSISTMSRRKIGRLRPVREGILQHDELVAAEPRDEDRFVDRPLQAFGDLLQQPIADRVTEGVVDRLEVVEVDQVHAERSHGRARTSRARCRSARATVMRFGRPVSSSYRASRAMRASALARSVTSSKMMTEPPSAMNRRDRAMVRSSAVVVSIWPEPEPRRSCSSTSSRAWCAALPVWFRTPTLRRRSSRARAPGTTALSGRPDNSRKRLFQTRSLLLPVEHAQAVRHVVER